MINQSLEWGIELTKLFHASFEQSSLRANPLSSAI